MPLPERQLIESLRRAVRSTSAITGRHVITGIGDDCAILRIPAGHDTLVTTDFSLEGVHFRREWHSPETVGHRCLARGLSDIAAMGGEPVAVFLSVALPAKLPQRWVNAFFRGLLGLARKFDMALAGGDTSTSLESVLADIVVIGSVPNNKAILRSTARPGDRIYVTGSLGGSAAALKILVSGKKVLPRDFPAHFHPMPRIEIGRTLRSRKLATAMIDISDGLSTDLSHICEESGAGAELWEQSLPLAEIGASRKPVELDDALHGGEDYELLFTASPKSRVPRSVAGVPVTCIGEITRQKRLVLVREENSRVKLEPRGWEHFGIGR